MYNYREAMKEDIRNAIEDNAEYWELDSMDREDKEEFLYEELWIDDGVTGNGSGSYTFNRWQAGEYVKENIELCREALSEFCTEAETIAEKFLEEDWEYFDVTIRCYLLGECIASVLDELEED